MSTVVDVVVVGAGIVGLATAHRVQQRLPGRRVVVLEASERVAAHQSSHNSGVLHAGVYYAPGSARAELCRRGKGMVERFADEHGVPREQNGKVVVAVDESELPRLAELHRRCVANGVPGATLLDADGLAEVEPAVAGLAALHSPSTGVTDFAQVCEVLAGLVTAGGGEVRTATPVVGLREGVDEVRVVTPHDEVRARVVVACAGLQSDRVAGLSGVAGDERVVPFRGGWLEVVGASAALVRGNVYPVPDPALPFLGVHATRGIDGRVLAGPNAVLALSRDDTGPRWALDRRDLADAVLFRGTWQLARRHLRHGLRELVEELWLPAAVRQLQRYVPDVDADDVVRGPFGVRAQLLRPDGSMVDDFAVQGTRRVVHVRNAPSPAATSALALGEELAGRVATRTG